MKRDEVLMKSYTFALMKTKCIVTMGDNLCVSD